MNRNPSAIILFVKNTFFKVSKHLYIIMNAGNLLWFSIFLFHIWNWYFSFSPSRKKICKLFPKVHPITISNKSTRNTLIFVVFFFITICISIKKLSKYFSQQFVIELSHKYLVIFTIIYHQEIWILQAFYRWQNNRYLSFFYSIYQEKNDFLMKTKG